MSTPNIPHRIVFLCVTEGRTSTTSNLTVVFIGELKMNLGEHFLTETYFCIYCGRGIYFHWMMCCRGFPKVKRLDRVQGGSNNSYFFCNLDGWKVILVVQRCFVLLFFFLFLSIFFFFYHKFNIVVQKSTGLIFLLKTRKSEDWT